MKFGGRNDCSRVVLLMVAVYFLPCFITLIVRVPPYGDVAPKSADMDAALLYEAEEVTDPCDVPRRLHESSGAAIKLRSHAPSRLAVTFY